MRVCALRLRLLLLGLWGQPQAAIRVEDRVDDPVSLYAATKRSGELWRIPTAHLFGIRRPVCASSRSMGRGAGPDMAAYLFTDAILAGRADPGLQRRADARATSPYRRHRRRHSGGARPLPPTEGTRTGSTISATIARRSSCASSRCSSWRSAARPICSCCRCSRATLPESFADIATAERDLGFDAEDAIEIGIPRFVEWYKAYHGLS